MILRTRHLLLLFLIPFALVITTTLVFRSSTEKDFHLQQQQQLSNHDQHQQDYKTKFPHGGKEEQDEQDEIADAAQKPENSNKHKKQHHHATIEERFNHESERLHIAMISHGWNLPKAKVYHATNTIKGPDLSLKMTVAGILQYTTNPVTLYFIVGEADKERINELMEPVKYWRASLEWCFVMLDEKKLDEWMDYIDHHPSHRTGMAGNIKFFYPLVFPQTVTKLLMLDTDVLIQHDLKDLWMHFHQFEDRQLYAMAPQWQGSVHPTKDNQFNAGVMLLRLDRMREVKSPDNGKVIGWLQLAKEAIIHWNAKTDPPYGPKCCTHGDQTVFHMIRVYYKGALGLSTTAHIPRHWNINKCHGYQGLKTHGEQLPKHMPYVGLVHLGCCKMCTKQKVGPRWAKVVDVLNGTDFGMFSLPTGRFSEEVKQTECKF